MIFFSLLAQNSRALSPTLYLCVFISAALVHCTCVYFQIVFIVLLRFVYLLFSNWFSSFYLLWISPSLPLIHRYMKMHRRKLHTHTFWTQCHQTNTQNFLYLSSPPVFQQLKCCDGIVLFYVFRFRLIFAYFGVSWKSKIMLKCFIAVNFGNFENFWYYCISVLWYAIFRMLRFLPIVLVSR